MQNKIWLGFLILYVMFFVGADCGDNLCTPEDIKIMSFNLRLGDPPVPNDWMNRRDLIFDSIIENSPDIIALQEGLYDPTFVHDPLNPDPNHKVSDILYNFPEYGIQTSSFGELYGDYILHKKSRLSLNSDEIEVVKVVGTQDDLICTLAGFPWKRYITRTAYIDGQSFIRFHVFNVHLCANINPNIKRHHLIQLTSKVSNIPSQEPVFVVGDFNATESTEFIQYMLGNSPIIIGSISYWNPLPLLDTYRVMHPTEIGGTFNNFSSSFNYGMDGKRIDYIFSEPAEIKSSSPDYRWTFHPNNEVTFPSDHYGVVTTLSAQQHPSCE